MPKHTPKKPTFEIDPFGYTVRDLARATGRTGGIGKQVSQLAKEKPRASHGKKPKGPYAV